MQRVNIIAVSALLMGWRVSSSLFMLDWQLRVSLITYGVRVEQSRHTDRNVDN